MLSCSLGRKTTQFRKLKVKKGYPNKFVGKEGKKKKKRFTQELFVGARAFTKKKMKKNPAILLLAWNGVFVCFFQYFYKCKVI